MNRIVILFCAVPWSSVNGVDRGGLAKPLSFDTDTEKTREKASKQKSATSTPRAGC